MPTQYKKKIYLGRHGKITGPLSPIEFERLVQSGEVDQYFWIWRSDQREWEPLDPPPPAILEPQEKIISQSYDVICHRHHTLVSGVLEQVTASSCELLTREDSPSPRLGTQGVVLLNLLDASSGKSVNLQGHVLQATREKEGWRYQLQWSFSPDLF